jgi:nitrous oxide reductase accessory protein NosL
MKIIVVGCCLALFSCNAQHDEAPQEPFNVNSNLRGNVEGAKIEEAPIV